MFEYNPVQRNFIPGDKWLYFELYTSPLISDSLIANEILTSATKLLEEKVISKWYFIRYNNPKYHLRVRFEINDHYPFDYVIEIINKNIKQYSRYGFLYDITINTYQREIERYGNDTISNAENIFFHDSDYIAQLLKEKTLRSGHYRWLAGIKSIDKLLNDFNMNLEKKKSLMCDLNKSFGNEFQKGPYQAKKISNIFREHKNDISEIIESPENKYSLINNLLNNRTLKTKDDIEKIEFISNIYLLNESLGSMISSFIHMSMNRLFSTNQRFNEMILYDLLFRYYKSKLAREKYGT